METRQVLLVDAFATEPLSGVPVAVVPGEEWTDSQLRALAGEFGTCGAVGPDSDRLRYVEREGFRAPASAAVAGCTGLLERGLIEAGAYTLAVERPAETTALDVSVETDRETTVAFPTQQVEDVAVSTDEIATALGIDEDALAEVSTDLQPGRTDGFGGTLFVPVDFLQHLGSVSPDSGALASLFEETGTCRVFAFTFDTLEAETDVHARIFTGRERSTAGSTGGTQFTAVSERPASGIASAGCGAYLSGHAAFDPDRERIRVESGHFLDRPATLSVTLADSPLISGRALVVLDGRVAVPEEDDDEIIEV